MNKTANLRRIMNEIKQIKENAEADSKLFTLTQLDQNMFHWEAIIYGPADSLYEGYQFKLDIQLPDNYPQSPLNMKFVTPIQHVNVNVKGDICLDILKNNWSAALNIRTVLISLISLLDKPNTEDPFNPDLAELYRTNKKKYVEKIKSACEKQAIRRV